jgi:GNAT superfamily N-acetyltransferase
VADQLTVRPFEDTDLDPVLDVLRVSLGETALLKRTPELFRWKHLENPFGRSIILLATEGDRIAGVRAFMRWNLTTVDGDIIRCVRAVDTATHPDFQRRGVFSTLTQAAVAEATSDGVHMIFNTPNPKSGGGYLKMGWAEVGPIGVQIRPSLSMVSAGADPDALPSPSEWLDPVRPAADLPTTRRPARGLRTPRGADYLAWRFTGHPTARYFQAGDGDGVAVLRPNVRNRRRELVISDLLGDDPRRAARAATSASRADYLAGWFSHGSPERSAATRAGLLPIPKVTALTLVCRPLVADLPCNPLTLASWDLAMSDLELL